MNALARITALLFAALLLPACGTSTAIKPAQRERIDRVTVDASVKVPEKPELISPGKSMGAMFGALGAAIASAAASGEEPLEKAVKEAGFDMAAVAREEFRRQLSSTASYGPKLAEDGGYRFVLEVPVYGLAQKFAFSSTWRVLMRIDYKLLAPDGSVLAADWKTSDQFGDAVQVTEEEMTQDPAALRNAFAQATRKVVAKLIAGTNL